MQPSPQKTLFAFSEKYLSITKNNFCNWSYFLYFLPFSKHTEKQFKFHEIGPGLSRQIISFYLNQLLEMGVPKKEFKIRKKYFDFIYKRLFVNTFSYSEKCIPVVEKCVKSLDFFKAVVFAIHSAETAIKKLEKYKKLDSSSKNLITEREINKKIKERRALWSEIENGLSRLLKNDKNYKSSQFNLLTHNDLAKNSMNMAYDDSVLTLHGHQFKEWIKNNCYWFFLKKPEIVHMGHYHIMLPMIRYNTIICFTGHFLKQKKSLFYKYYFSHLGGATYAFDKKTKKLAHLTILRLT